MLMQGRRMFRPLAYLGVLFVAALAGADSDLPGDGGRSGEMPDLTKLNFVRGIYNSEGGMGEAYYVYDGRFWARWETDFPEGENATLTVELAEPREFKLSLRRPRLPL